MADELSLYQLFKDIISKSKMMNRFVTAPEYGVELNKDNLGEILKDSLEGISDGEKFPVCLMFPPVEVLPDSENAWSNFKIRMFFLTPPYTLNSATVNHDFGNNLSQHTIQETWKDMRLCAVDFRKAFKLITLRNPTIGIRDGQNMDVVERYSNVGNDKLSGVGISFDVSIFTGCDIEDYSISDIRNFKINTDNLHPHDEH